MAHYPVQCPCCLSSSSSSGSSSSSETDCTNCAAQCTGTAPVNFTAILTEHEQDGTTFSGTLTGQLTPVDPGFTPAGIPADSHCVWGWTDDDFFIVLYCYNNHWHANIFNQDSTGPFYQLNVDFGMSVTCIDGEPTGAGAGAGTDVGNDNNSDSVDATLVIGS